MPDAGSCATIISSLFVSANLRTRLMSPLSTLTATTRSPFEEYSRLSESSAAISSWHDTHHVAHTFSTVGGSAPPTRTVSPASVGAEYDGTLLPTASGLNAAASPAPDLPHAESA